MVSGFTERGWPASLLRLLGAGIRCQRVGNDRLVHLDVDDGRDVDAGWLVDVDGVDANARTDVARLWSVIPGHVGRDDGSDDAAVLGADALALPPGRGHEGRKTPGLADLRSGRWLLLCLDRVRDSHLSGRRRSGGA